jgi:hypothetical protein
MNAIKLMGRRGERLRRLRRHSAHYTGKLNRDHLGRLAGGGSPGQLHVGLKVAVPIDVPRSIANYEAVFAFMPLVIQMFYLCKFE